MKLLKVGVYHHGCWGSFSTKDFPNISMTEMGAIRVVKKTKKGALVNCFMHITGERNSDLSRYMAYLKTIPSIKQFKTYEEHDNEAYSFVQFLSSTSSYDSVLKTNALPFGPIVQEKELEIHTVLTEKPTQTTRFLNELEQLGEVKVMKISDFKEENVLAALTDKQRNALLGAFCNNYYSWPRRVNLDQLSAKLGVKRRTFQEHLRLAEAKFIPFAIEKLIKEKKI